MKKHSKKYAVVLGVSTAVNILILMIRNAIVGNSDYNFLMWNLFLGAVPFLTAFAMILFGQNWKTTWLLLGAGLWLLFYPNAPYMITDLIHVNDTSSTVVYDACIIFCFAILSAFFGFYSFGLVRSLLSGKLPNWAIRLLVFASLFLSSFGIYLGRVLRLNSWDLFTKPIQTLGMIIDHLIPISKNPTTYTMILLFSFLQLMFVYLVVDLKDTDENL